MANILDLMQKNPEDDYGVQVDIDGFCDQCLQTAENMFYNKETKVLTSVCANGHVISQAAPELEWLV